jgi:thiosulfate reductase cytochrome b subunit
MSDRIYLLPVWIRLWHWANALLIITLAITGISLHFADSQAAAGGVFTRGAHP